MYLLPSLNMKLRPKLLDMRPGTRIVSHAFTMEDWQPDQTATVEGRDAYLWIVPAKVGGNWKLAVPAGQRRGVVAGLARPAVPEAHRQGERRGTHLRSRRGQAQRAERPVHVRRRKRPEAGVQRSDAGQQHGRHDEDAGRHRGEVDGGPRLVFTLRGAGPLRASYPGRTVAPGRRFSRLVRAAARPERQPSNARTVRWPGSPAPRSS